ncbi:MAG: TolC family protein [Gemmatimonadetes bacterium]|nr:TolC family protein [Gemmatimonadota bacterium]
MGRRWLGALIAVTLVAGCGTAGVAPSTRPVARSEPMTPEGSSSERRADNPVGDITLQDAISLVVRQRPELAAFGWERSARDAQLRQAGAYPNPVVEGVAENVAPSAALRPFSGVGGVVQSQTTVTLSQLIELGGERSARREAATAQRDVATADYDLARLAAQADATQAFLAVYVAQEAVALADQTVQLAQSAETNVGARVEAGDLAPIESTRAAVVRAAAAVELARARRDLAMHRERLAAMWGSSTATFGRAVGDLPTPLEPPVLSALAARLPEAPQAIRRAALVRSDRGLLALERAKRIPDVALAAGLRRFGDLQGQAYVVGATLTLPLFDRNGGGIAEAVARVAKAEETSRADQLHAGVAVAAAHRAAQTAFDELRALDTTVLPGAIAAFDAVTEGFRLGKFGYLDVLEVQRTLIASKGQRLRALLDYYHATAELERLLGSPIDPTPRPSPPPGEES